MPFAPHKWSAVTMGVFLCASFASARASQADQDRTAKPEVLFTMTNDSDRNQVVTLVGPEGGPFRETHRYDTGGRGAGSNVPDTLNSQGAVTLSEDRSLLFVVNAGTSELSVFRVDRDNLLLVDRVPTGGGLPVSVAQRGNRVYVLNQGGAGVITGFDLSSGHLKRIPKANAYLTMPLTGGSQVGISPDGNFLIAIELIPNLAGPSPSTYYIDTYKINADGTVGPLVANPAATAGGVAPFSFNVTKSGQLLVTDAGAASIGPPTYGSGVTSYQILPSGKLSTITGYVPSLALAPCWSVLTADGKHMYVANNVSSNISGFNVAADRSLTPLDATVLASDPPNSTNIDLALSSDGKYLYNLNPTSNSIGIFGINDDGSLTTVTPIDVPNATSYTGLAAL